MIVNHHDLRLPIFLVSCRQGDKSPNGGSLTILPAFIYTTANAVDTIAHSRQTHMSSIDFLIYIKTWSLIRHLNKKPGIIQGCPHILAFASGMPE